MGNGSLCVGILRAEFEVGTGELNDVPAAVRRIYGMHCSAEWPQRDVSKYHSSCALRISRLGVRLTVSPR